MKNATTGFRILRFALMISAISLPCAFAQEPGKTTTKAPACSQGGALTSLLDTFRAPIKGTPFLLASAKKPGATKQPEKGDIIHQGRDTGDGYACNPFPTIYSPYPPCPTGCHYETYDGLTIQICCNALGCWAN